MSVAAGVLAIVSAVPSLAAPDGGALDRAVVLITLVNLRGVRESGRRLRDPDLRVHPRDARARAHRRRHAARSARARPRSCRISSPAGRERSRCSSLLRAFASGSSALTGVEAISNGVSAFRHPQARNAARTLGILAVIAITLFMGVSWLAVRDARAPVGQRLGRLAGRAGDLPGGSAFGFMFWVVQITTFAILVLAANTSFQGFPRLAAMLAHDRFFPRQFGNLGDRLVYSNGIVVLSGLAVFLLWAYDANVDSLIHLYVIGVFTAFTLSQAGMVRYWRRAAGAGLEAERGGQRRGGGLDRRRDGDRRRRRSSAQGAWLVIIAIPLLVLMFLGIHRHYRRFAPAAACRRSRDQGLARRPRRRR